MRTRQRVCGVGCSTHKAGITPDSIMLILLATNVMVLCIHYIWSRHFFLSAVHAKFFSFLLEEAVHFR